MNNFQLSLYIVDDNEAVRQSLDLLMLSRGYVVQTFDSGEDFLASVNEQHNGCVILDLRLGGMSGLEVLEILRSRRSNLVILFLSGHGDIPAAVKAVQNGAFGWLEKPCSDEVLLEKVQQAYAQAELISVQKAVLKDTEILWQKLTPREKEVALLVAEGKSSKIIARDLKTIDPRTVESHRARVFSKLGVSNSNELDRFLRLIIS